MDWSKNVNELRGLGCGQQTKLSVAVRVFEDLKLGNDYLITAKHDRDFEILYLRTEAEDCQVSIYLPFLDTEKIDFELINKLSNKLGNEENSQHTQQKSVRLRLFLAICDTSSNVLYYNVTHFLKEKQN
ncbi:uncharacterized protein LOC106090152 [Stomoxys calcitrans]|uniref:tRNA-splicing endonuclease subunit Sen15 domain-containing protein n=1 Tax=Stomoxys calcitrans TaxID=35570 RepID=A0A1I8PWW5_STOCA|nr:uncharacterized protein LOC106090152 [Stomoxys calcitrans]